MVEVIEKAHEVFELTNSDIMVLVYTSFACGILISDGFTLLVRFFLKLFKRKFGDKV